MVDDRARGQVYERVREARGGVNTRDTDIHYVWRPRVIICRFLLYFFFVLFRYQHAHTHTHTRAHPFRLCAPSLSWSRSGVMRWTRSYFSLSFFLFLVSSFHFIIFMLIYLSFFIGFGRALGQFEVRRFPRAPLTYPLRSFACPDALPLDPTLYNPLFQSAQVTVIWWQGIVLKHRKFITKEPMPCHHVPLLM